MARIHRRSHTCGCHPRSITALLASDPSAGQGLDAQAQGRGNSQSHGGDLMPPLINLHRCDRSVATRFCRLRRQTALRFTPLKTENREQNPTAADAKMLTEADRTGYETSTALTRRNSRSPSTRITGHLRRNTHLEPTEQRTASNLGCG